MIKYSQIKHNLTINNVYFRWHRIGISVKGDSATLIIDCQQQITKKLDRSAVSKIAYNGLLLIGVQLDEEADYFTGDIQLLQIANRPDEAYNICTKYSPICRNIGEIGGYSNINSGGVQSSRSSSYSSSASASSTGHNSRTATVTPTPRQYHHSVTSKGGYSITSGSTGNTRIHSQSREEAKSMIDQVGTVTRQESSTIRTVTSSGSQNLDLIGTGDSDFDLYGSYDDDDLLLAFGDVNQRKSM